MHAKPPARPSLVHAACVAAAAVAETNDDDDDAELMRIANASADRPRAGLAAAVASITAIACLHVNVNPLNDGAEEF